MPINVRDKDRRQFEDFYLLIRPERGQVSLINSFFYKNEKVNLIVLSQKVHFRDFTCFVGVSFMFI